MRLMNHHIKWLSEVCNQADLMQKVDPTSSRCIWDSGKGGLFLGMGLEEQ